MAKVNRSVTIDEALLDVSKELLPNRSLEAEKGILDAVVAKLDEMRPDIAKPYRKKIEHLIKQD